jgi:hypothetical protein
MLLASHMLCRIYLFNNYPQDRSSDPSKSLGRRGARKFAFQHLRALRTSYDEIVYKIGEISGAF